MIRGSVAQLTYESMASALCRLFNVGMISLMQRLRNRRHADLRARAIQSAMRNAPSSALRRELMEIASRYE
jgi:hypothetical protein